MYILIVCIAFTAGLTGFLRRLGASRKLALAFGLLPMGILLAGLALTGRLELGPHGGIIPAWVTVTAGFLIAGSVAGLTAVVVREKPAARPVQNPRRDDP